MGTSKAMRGEKRVAIMDKFKENITNISKHRLKNKGWVYLKDANNKKVNKSDIVAKKVTVNMKVDESW